MRVAARMARLGTETAFEAAARARALEATGRDIIHLEIGEPDFDTPGNVRAAAKQRARRDGCTHYGPALGLPVLREAIARRRDGAQGLPGLARRVVVTPGAKPIMFFAITALVDRTATRSSTRTRASRSTSRW